MTTDRALLPDEDLETGDPVEVQHWISIYEHRLQILRRRLQARRDGGLRDRLAAYQSQLEFWRDRHAELIGLVVDRDARTLSGRSGTVHLTRRELQLLGALADHPGRHFPPATLVARAWPDSDLSEEQLRTYLVRLRRKLVQAGAGARIHADRPRGYVLRFEDCGEARLSASA